jgi:selenide, water dikinase
MPVIANMIAVDAHVKIFKLRAGFSAETSGGLLLAIPESNAAAFCSELQQLDGQPAWIIGRVIANPSGNRTSNTADIIDNCTILEI